MEKEVKSSQKTSAKRPTGVKIEKERLNFRALTLANPNYFGNIKESTYPVKKLMLKNVSFEELKCLGFNPQTEQLEAVVHVKQSTGYGGQLCSQGTKEYVRFYLSYDSGVTWTDQGMASFSAHDVPGPKPLEFSVRLKIDPANKFCTFENLPKVLAILSWDTPPPANQPAFNPVYGNRMETNIQIGAGPFLILKDFLELAELKKLPPIIDLLDLEQKLIPKPPVGPGPLKLAPAYLKSKVQPHRLLFNEIHAAMTKPAAMEMLATPAIESVLQLAKVDIGKIIEAFLATDGDKSYEELYCLGMSQGAINWLTASFKIKKTCGYLGGLCSDGSKEYVAFWVDWGDGAGWTYAGTGEVKVFDLSHMPAGGVSYTVSIPVNTLPHRQPCSQGPKTARVRAILSWETAPPPGDPNYIPKYGNREETRILIPPGPAIILEDYKMYVDSVANMAVCDIDQTTGLANGPGQIAAFNAVQAPFGGTIRLTGFIANPPNAMADPTKTLKYRVSVRRLDNLGAPVTGWQPLANDFDIVITKQDGVGMPVQYHYNQQIDSTGFYTYWEQAYTNQWRQVTMDKLASWETRGLTPGLWEITVEVKLPNGTILPPGTISCIGGGTRSTVVVCLDEKAPSASIAITGYLPSGGTGTPIPATNCGTFMKGEKIVGKYSTFDPESHWRAKSIYVLPSGPAHGVVPAVTIASTGPAGESGTWELVTSGMDPCGYIIHLWTEDRTIVDSGHIGWENGDSAGFCVRVG
ncbi:MAG: hypothetical protein ABIJ39_06065 [Chloroflexota bacterium]